jgi:hypothetical protein
MKVYPLRSLGIKIIIIIINMKNSFSNLWKFVASGGTILAYQAWYDRMTNKSGAVDMKNYIKQIDTKIDNLTDKIDNCVDPAEKAKLLGEINEGKANLQNLWDIHSNYIEKHKGLMENSDMSKSLFEEYKETFSAAFEKTLKQCDEFDKSISNISKKFMDDNLILQKISEFKDYLATLSSTEICLVMNISISVLILTCLASIIFSVYGNFLIEKLSLQSKYPKLSSIISLRVKLQHSYIIINTSFIVGALILMFFVNLITLIHG